jgi:hypothetical protein
MILILLLASGRYPWRTICQAWLIGAPDLLRSRRAAFLQKLEV